MAAAFVTSRRWEWFCWLAPRRILVAEWPLPPFSLELGPSALESSWFREDFAGGMMKKDGCADACENV